MRTDDTSRRSHNPLLVLLLILFAGGCGRPDTASLEEVPRPDLGRLAEPLRQQLTAERQELDRRLADPPAAAEMGAAFGRMASYYHAYGLAEAAAACYRNARLLLPEDPRWSYLQGVLEQEGGDQERAAELFAAALEQRGDDVAVVLRLAEMELGLGRSQAAGEHFRRAALMAGGEAAAHFGLGRLAMARDDFAAAAAEFEEVLELQPEATNVHPLLGLAYRRLGRREEAERQMALLGASVEVRFPDPLIEEVEALVIGVGPVIEKALRAYGAGRFDEAVAGYREALAQEPENLTALRGLGLSLRAAGRLDESIEAYQRLLAVQPDHRLGGLELAMTQIDRGDYTPAIERLEAAVAADPEFKEAHFNLGVALSRVDRWAEAERHLRRVLELSADYPRTRYYLGVVLDELGRDEEAVVVLREAVRRDPADFLSRQRLGYLLAAAGDVAGAELEHRAVLELEVAPAPEKAAAHFQLGSFARDRGVAAEAEEHFRAAVELFPDLWQARLSLARLLRDRGDADPAVAEYRAIVERYPEHETAWFEEAWVLLRARRYAAAQRTLEEGVRSAPRSLSLAHLLARLLATGPDAALRDGGRALELAQRVFDAQQSAEHAETLAMALAENGRFDEAVELQRQLLAQAESLGRPDLELARLSANLELYQKRQPSRLPPA